MLVGLAISAGLLGLEIYLFRALWPSMTTRDWGIVFGATIAYVLFASVVKVNPDHGNMGLFGGLVDNPFSLSDDINRFLLFVQLMLMPGKLLAWSIASAIRRFLANAPKNRSRR